MNSSVGILNSETLALIVVGLFIGMILIVAYVTLVVVPFAHNIIYLKMEYRRSIGREKKKWKRRIIRAYLNLIPGLGNLLIR